MFTDSLRVVLGLAALAAVTGAVHGETITIPNGDFKLADANALPYATPNIADWQKAPKPGWFLGTDSDWSQTAGVFYNVNFPGSYITNLASTQAAFVFAQPGVELYQDLGTTFEAGKSYSLAFGLISSTAETPFVGALKIGTTIDAVLYYRDALNNRVDVGRKSVANTVEIGNRTLMSSFVLDVPAVAAGDAWAGKDIGVQFLSTSDFTNSGGVWDVGNVALTAEAGGAVPEPASLAMMGVGCLALLYRRR